MRPIPLNLLHAHPGNANRMSEPMFAKLRAHLARGECPPLIVRPHPAIAGAYEILDGHHRAAALRANGGAEAPCAVWEADDDRAALLLLTLNRVHGEDDPRKRGELLRRLADSTAIEEMKRLLPDSAAEVSRLLALVREAPPPPAPPREVGGLPRAVTFFLSPPRHRALIAKLNAVARDRSEGLARLLDLDAGDDDAKHARRKRRVDIAHP